MKKSIIILILLSVFSAASAETALSDLRTKHLSAPLGIDPAVRPTVSWVISSTERNTVQTAYEVSVSKNGKKVWGSGRVDDSESACVPLDLTLEKDSRYTWSVRIWDNHGNVTKRYSSSFGTGLSPKDWQAQWIGASSSRHPLYFSAERTARKKIRCATMYITSHGTYEAWINGRRVGDFYLTPGWTSYTTRLQYQAYDVTGMLRIGKNPIEVLVAPGWYSSGMNWGAPGKRFRYGEDMMLLCQISVTYTDGSQENWISDGDWKMSEGEVREATIYDGETVDHNAVREWKQVLVANLAPSNVIASVSTPVVKHDPVRPVKYIVTPKGEKVLDFGQNLVGWEKISIRGNRGDTVRVFHAEILDNDGNFYTSNLRNAKATSTYILSGSGRESFEPTHTFYGFRYIKVDGVKEDLNMDDFEAIPVYSGFDTIGHFASSNSEVNQLQSNIEWGFHGNFVDIPTDCPQRDERLGWTGDAQVFFRTASFLGRVDRFFEKWLLDVAADQRSDGGIPRVVPDTFKKTDDGKENRRRVGAVGWADCATIIPWNHFMAYGDRTILENQYESMKGWVDCVARDAEKCGWLWKIDKGHYGDWLFWSVNNDVQGESAITSKALLGQCFFANSLSILVRSAEILGKTDDCKHYSDILKKVKQAYLDEYVTKNGLVSSDTQTAYVLALQFDMLPEHLRKGAAERLVANVKRYNDHITTGFLGTPHICNVLTDSGHSDVAYRLLLQRTCPGWLYPITMGATTIWERWDSILPDGKIPENGMNSFNHYSYGAIGDWLYRSAVGIRETSPGYRTISIRPHVGGDFEWMEASTVTPYGRVAAKWRAEKNVLRTLEVTIPANTRAKVYVPARNAGSVSVDADLKGTFGNGEVEFELGSGSYTFTMKD